MSEPPSQQPSKRRIGSPPAAEAKRQRTEEGVYIRQPRFLSPQALTLCQTLLRREFDFVACTLYPESAFSDILVQTEGLNDTRIQRDLMPRLVPPAEMLRYHGEPIPTFICEDVNAPWRYCQADRGFLPRPDYTAGLSPDSFTDDEVDRLQLYATPQAPFFVTPELCFPFLAGEAKGGDRATSRNIGNGDFAVSAVLELYKAAFGKSEPHRVNELYGELLAFTVSLNHRFVTVRGHYAVIDDYGSNEKFLFHDIDAFMLTVEDSANRNRSYNFVRNLYEIFAPQHLKRIKDAVVALPTPEEPAEPSPSDLFALPPEFKDPPQGPLETTEDGQFRVPGEPASVINARARIMRHVEKENMMGERIGWLMKQLKTEREASKEREDRLQRQLDRQRDHMEDLVQQIEDQTYRGGAEAGCQPPASQLTRE